MNMLDDYVHYKDKTQTSIHLYSFDNFMTCEGNMFAYNAAKAVACGMGQAYSPLFIYGESGTGKTHLLKAIEIYIKETNSDLNVLYVSAEEFVNDVITAIRSQDNSCMCMIRDMYRNVDILIIDDIDFLIDKDSSLKEFCHTFDALQRSGSQIVLSANKAPKNLAFDELMRYRIGKGLVVEIKAPNSELKKSIIHARTKKAGLLLEDEVVNYIASSTGSNMGELEGAITSIIGYSELLKPAITLDIAKRVLKDIVE